MNIQKNVILKNYTTYKVGGPVEYFFIAKNIEELKQALVWASEKGIEVTILGGGSNVVISDNGLKGLVIVNKSNEIEVLENRVRADSGVLLKNLVGKVLENGKGGIEFLANIPGTVGGAVAVNAGCYRKFVADYLKKATIFHNLHIFCSLSVAKRSREEKETRSGELSIKSSNKSDFCIEEVGNDFFEFEYRTSKIKKGYEAVVLDATFEIADTDIEESKRFITEDRKRRDTKHPNEPSCGSFFKNPSKENIAGELIEKSGLKGFAVGGAKVSEKHANFIVNAGDATASDIKNLANYIKKIVKEKTGFELEEEVKYLGEFK